MIQTAPGRLTLRNITVFRTIALAYGFHCKASNEMGLIEGLPSWVGTRHFDIVGTLPAGSPYYSMRQLVDGDAPILQTMLRNMLEERFHLTLHRGSKEANLYNLVLVRLGKIKPSEDQSPVPPPPPPTEPASPLILPGDPMPRGALGLELHSEEGRVGIDAYAVPIKAIINIFQGDDGRLVIDKTGLKGLYDVPQFTANVGPFEMAPGAFSVWPEVMQQLGLRLEATRGPVETLIIDRLEMPTEN